MHDAARAFVARTLAGLPPRRSVVEIGSRHINGQVRDLLNGAAYTGLDLYEGEGVDIVVDALDWSPPAPVDTVLCLEVLEHAADPAALCARACAWLEPGGVLILTAAGDGRPRHSGIDGGPLREGESYANVSESALLSWLGQYFYVGTADVRIVVDRPACDIYAVAIRR